MKTKAEILDSIRKRFSDKTGQSYEEGSILDLFSSAVSDELEEVYQEIENNKNPHVWSKLEGENLDSTGYWLNCPRDPAESDMGYKYRLMKWVLRNEASNTTAIKTALMNPDEASYMDFVPFTKGCGTGTVYAIPKHYTEESIKDALKEAASRVKKAASSVAHIDFVIPTVQAISLEVYLKTNGDEAAIKKEIETQITNYVNDIAPKDYLSVGQINKIGVNTAGVEYFSVLSLIVDGEQVNKTKVLQKIDCKFLLDTVTWVGDVDDENI